MTHYIEDDDPMSETPERKPRLSKCSDGFCGALDCEMCRGSAAREYAEREAAEQEDPGPSLREVEMDNRHQEKEET